MIKLDVKVSFTPGSQAKLPIQCPQCKKTSEYPASKLKRGAVIVCLGCGAEIKIANDGFETAAKGLKNLFKKR